MIEVILIRQVIAPKQVSKVFMKKVELPFVQKGMLLSGAILGSYGQIVRDICYDFTKQETLVYLDDDKETDSLPRYWDWRERK